MSTTDRFAQLEAERQRIRAASQRLLTGTSACSNGKLAIVALSTEAGVSRQRLYEYHPDLVSDFKASAGAGPIAPNVEALQQQMVDAREQIKELKAREAENLDQLKTLCAVIAELTHQNHTSNLVALPTAGIRPPQ